MIKFQRNIFKETTWKSTRLLSKLALMCPGQGSQYVGMFQNINNKYGFDDQFGDESNDYTRNILHTGNNGPQALLNKTINCQPAVVLSSILAYEKLKKNLNEYQVSCVAGYSVGEISALYIAGYLSFEDVLRLIKARAEAMQHASDITETGMVNVRGLTHQGIYQLCDDLNKITSEKDMISVAIKMYPRSVALGGSAVMLNKVLERKHHLIKDESDVKISPIPVSGAFHTPYMAPAQDAFQRALESVHWLPSDVCLYSNVTGKPYTVEKNKSDLLVRQLCETVRWSSILEDVSRKLADTTVTKLIEVGPGKQLRTMVGKVNRKAIRCTESFDL